MSSIPTHQDELNMLRLLQNLITEQQHLNSLNQQRDGQGSGSGSNQDTNLLSQDLLASIASDISSRQQQQQSIQQLQQQLQQLQLQQQQQQTLSPPGSNQNFASLLSFNDNHSSNNQSFNVRNDLLGNTNLGSVNTSLGSVNTSLGSSSATTGTSLSSFFNDTFSQEPRLVQESRGSVSNYGLDLSDILSLNLSNPDVLGGGNLISNFDLPSHSSSLPSLSTSSLLTPSQPSPSTGSSNNLVDESASFLMNALSLQRSHNLLDTPNQGTIVKNGSHSHGHSHQSQLAINRFESQIRSIANDIQTTIQLHLNGLQMRKEQLLKQLEQIKQIYSSVIITMQQQNPSVGSSFNLLPQIYFTRPDSALYKAVTSLGFLSTPAFASNCIVTGEGLEVATEGQPALFSITTRNCFNEDLLLGGEKIDIEISATTSATPSVEPNLVGDQVGLQRQQQQQQQQQITIPHSMVDLNNGKYTCSYTVPRNSQITSVIIRIIINSLPIKGSPFLVKVETQRARHPWRRILTYGIEGNEPGHFCRPWGVACVSLNVANNNSTNNTNDLSLPLSNDLVSASSSSSSTSSSPPQMNQKEYLIALADRSNNRIQLLKLMINNNATSASTLLPTISSPSISVLHIFGSGPGTRPGQFDRPAGIAINITLGHIIVADKDNHRVQVFDMNGNYQFKFGEKGSRAGQFCYPWDLDSNPVTHQILVSDTRNRRVQMFTSYGQYLWHVGQPLDSPRGVSFLSADKFVVSDFNKHRLLILDKPSASLSTKSTSNDDPNNQQQNNLSPKYVGFGEGSAWGEFLRPQGVATGLNGSTVYCSDSRNNRISIWCSSTQNFEYLSEEIISLDRPAGLAVADNILVVVDFGNNRIQICQR